MNEKTGYYKEQIHFNMCLKEILKNYLTEIFYTHIRTSKYVSAVY